MHESSAFWSLIRPKLCADSAKTILRDSPKPLAHVCDACARRRCEQHTQHNHAGGNSQPFAGRPLRDCRDGPDRLREITLYTTPPLTSLAQTAAQGSVTRTSFFVRVRPTRETAAQRISVQRSDGKRLRLWRWLRLLLAARRCGTTDAGTHGRGHKKKSTPRYDRPGNDGRRRSVGLRGVLPAGLQRAESTCRVRVPREGNRTLRSTRKHAKKATGRRDRRRLATDDLLKGLGSQGSRRKNM
mmetsp:Transcript_22373/g.68702  ORF Transcript_22373/g.68702 Transcript_22373/m.68702 type:complete len:242 (+) Transcript_22373:819-1544(+)